MQVLANGGELAFTPDSHTIYSINPASVTKQDPSGHLLALFDVLEKIYTGKNLGVQESSPYSRGLNSMNVKPSHDDKKAQLVSRLIGVFLGNCMFANGRDILQQLLRNKVIETATLDLLEHNSPYYADIVYKEIIRFSFDTVQLTKECVMQRVNCLRLADFLPMLSTEISNKEDF